MSEVNKVQIAGTHYRTSFQHWDFVVQMRLGYFEGQITKYTTRHRKKNGMQDVQKALHFAQKLHEVTCRVGRVWPRMPLGDYELAVMDVYCAANHLTDLEQLIVRSCCRWQTEHDLLDLIETVGNLLDTYEGDATPEYVNQDR